jgi:molybdenum cofactor cytidylyltransferase
MIPGIVLAAGRSSRMGRLKPNLPAGPAARVAGDTILIHLLRTLIGAGLDDVVIVVGYEKDAVAASVAATGLPARFVENPDYDSGQLSSLLAGLRVVDRPGVIAAVVALADVPFVSEQTVRAVLARYQDTRVPVVRPSRGGQHGHPTLVDRSVFEELRRADRAAGAKPVVRARATPAGDVPTDDEGAYFDLDTPADYERAIKVFGADRSQRWDT